MARRKRRFRPANPLLEHARPRSDGAERDQRVHREGVAPDQGAPKRTRLADAIDAADLRPCAICSRATRGFYYTHLLLPDRSPTYTFCAMRCLQAGAAIAKRNRGMIDKTRVEARAIKAARRTLAEVLTELGLIASFHDRSAQDIDRIIEACVDGFQDAMQREALNDEIPF